MLGFADIFIVGHCFLLNQLGRFHFVALCGTVTRKLSILFCSYLVSIVGPGSEGQVTFLAVKGKVRDVDHTGALGDGGSVPGDLSIIA